MAKTPQKRTTAPKRTTTRTVAKQPAAPAAKLTVQMVDDVKGYRLAQLEHDVPVKTRADFASDAAYKEYLLDSYVSLRQQEYNYMVQNETMKVYNLACDADTKVRFDDSHHDNLLVWDGYQKYIDAAKTPEERKRREQQVADCAMSRVPQMGGMCISNKLNPVTPNKGLHCCAITASAEVAQISGKMGYDGAENLVIAKYRGDRPGRRNNMAGARYIADQDSVQNQIQHNPNIRFQPDNNGRPLTLNEAVRTGKLKVGDSFALAPKNPNSETTGHAMVVADIIRDDKGNITHYTIQGNNPHELLTYGINDLSSRAGRLVTAGVGTNAFVEGKFVAERQDLSKLSVEELEAKVVEQRGKTEQVIADLGSTEKFNIEHGFYTLPSSKGFTDKYVKMHQVATSYKTTAYSDVRTELHDDYAKFTANLKKIENGDLAFREDEPTKANTNTNNTVDLMLWQQRSGRA